MQNETYNPNNAPNPADQEAKLRFLNEQRAAERVRGLARDGGNPSQAQALFAGFDPKMSEPQMTDPQMLVVLKIIVEALNVFSKTDKIKVISAVANLVN